MAEPATARPPPPDGLPPLPISGVSVPSTGDALVSPPPPTESLSAEASTKALPPPQGGTIDAIFKALQSSSKGMEVSKTQPIILLKGDSSKTPQTVTPQAKVTNNRRANGPKPPLAAQAPKKKPQFVAGPPAVTQTSKAWKDLFQNSNSSPTHEEMTYTEPTMEGDQPVVEVAEEDYDSAIAQWGKAVVGYVIGTTPVYIPFLQFLKRLWKPKGEIHLMLKGNGFFVVNFDNEEDLQVVLEGGPWTMASRPFVLQRWSPFVKIELERLTTIPIWIKFPDLPLHMWTLECLSKIASAIGVPLYRDAATRLGTRISFARVCVEIAVGSTLPDKVVVNSKLGGQQEFLVSYDWKPKACTHCFTFGHDDAMCCKKPQISSAVARVIAPKVQGAQIWQEVKTKKASSSIITPPQTLNGLEGQPNQFEVLQNLQISECNPPPPIDPRLSSGAEVITHLYGQACTQADGKKKVDIVQVGVPEEGRLSEDSLTEDLQDISEQTEEVEITNDKVQTSTSLSPRNGHSPAVVLQLEEGKRSQESCEDSPCKEKGLSDPQGLNDAQELCVMLSPPQPHPYTNYPSKECATAQLTKASDPIVPPSSSLRHTRQQSAKPGQKPGKGRQ
ncbi:hypothetical protein QJS10_CPB14g01366 [Acorus calamus]|uniref:DUF4283 domain-containing protein n=1 Tax=Acorus calamus TaxID=4465 RepID=A0AAV9DDC9_ACOCL|nr:hypothetical protein QJS10_CPB14g01366 [Acorus calamus]